MRLNVVVLTVAVAVPCLVQAADPDQNWPRFRGAHARGVADGHPTPTRWSVESGEGVLWRTPIPGLAHSSPVVWGDSVFLTTAVNEKGGSFLKIGLYGSIDPVPDEGPHRFVVYRIDKRTGKILWERVAFEGTPRRPRHGVVYIQCDVLNDPFLAAFDLESGEQLWRTPRDDVPTWSTPTVHESGERTLLLVNGWKHAGGYDAATGKEIWRLSGGGDIPVPGPVVAHNLVFITNAHGSDSPIYAVRLDAKGDISLEGDATANRSIAWSIPRGGAYMQTPLVYGDLLYNCRDNGVLSVYDAKTGDRKYQQRLGKGGGGFTASPVAADGKVYFTSEEGDVYVVKAGSEYELLATNALDEVTMASPALSEGTLFFRTRTHLVAVGSAAAASLD